MHMAFSSYCSYRLTVQKRTQVKMTGVLHVRVMTFEVAFFQQLHGAGVYSSSWLHAFINYTAAVLCEACVESHCMPVKICMQ